MFNQRILLIIYTFISPHHTKLGFQIKCLRSDTNIGILYFLLNPPSQNLFFFQVLPVLFCFHETASFDYSILIIIEEKLRIREIFLLKRFFDAHAFMHLGIYDV